MHPRALLVCALVCACATQEPFQAEQAPFARSREEIRAVLTTYRAEFRACGAGPGVVAAALVEVGVSGAVLSYQMEDARPPAATACLRGVLRRLYFGPAPRPEVIEIVLPAGELLAPSTQL